MNDTFFPVRPEASLVSILVYAFIAFAMGLALTPSFIRFLRKNRLGKQLRVETVDGREASIFRKYHEKKFGTPTMGGILIWGSIVFTILVSRVFALLGWVPNSLLQRGQVYVPLFTLLTLGVIGAIDDYLNVVGADEDRWKKLVAPSSWFFGFSTLAFLGAGIWMNAIYGISFIAHIGIILPPLVILVLYVWGLLYLGAGVAVLDHVSKKFGAGVNQKKKGGLAVLPKITSLLVIALVVTCWFFFKLKYDTVFVPFVGAVTIGWWYIPLAVFVIVGTTNAVNVTDGLDGLAGGLLVLAFAAFGVISFFSGLTVLAAFCAVTAGAIAAFLWHNVPPALFYMGDTGALALGGVLGVIALMIDQVVVLPLVGAVFVIEMLSVIIQLTSKRLRGGKKVFKAAPIHHHFEALEWGESKVTMRLWIIGAFCAFLGIVIGLYGVRQKTAMAQPAEMLQQ